MVEIRGFTVLVGACIAITLLAACSDWPPHGNGLSEYASERAPEIEELVSEFDSSEFGRIDCQPCFADKPLSEWDTVSYRFTDGKWRKSENADSRKYAEMFWNAGVMSVFKRSSGEVELGVAVPSERGAKRYVVQLFHDPDHNASTIKECVAEFEDIDCGWCKVSIDDKLWIRYQWYLDDPDPAASRARDDGDISWEEWEARYQAAEEACLRDGLTEQGYKFDED